MPTITISDNTGATYAGAEDTYLDESVPTTNRNGNSFFDVGRYDTESSVGLVKFTGLSNITGPVTVTSATLRLYIQDAFGGAAHTMSLRPLLLAFTEGGATWNTRNGTNAWNTAGALGNGTDRGSTVLTSTNVGTTQQYYEWTSASLAQYVQDAINGVTTDHGLHIERTDGGGDFQYRTFTADTGTDGQRPELVVTYTAGTPALGPRLYSGLGHGPIGAGPTGDVVRGTLTPSGGAFTMNAEPATFVITVSPVAVYKASRVNLEPSSYAINVADVFNYVVRKVNLEPAAYTVVVSPVSVYKTSRTNLEPTSYTITAADVAGYKAFRANLEPTDYAITTAAVESYKHSKTNLEPTAFTITASAVSVVKAGKVNLEPTAYTLTAAAVEMQVTRKLHAEPGTFLITAQPVSASAHRVVDLEPTSYAIAGFDATFTFTPAVGAFEMNAEPGAFGITGTPVWAALFVENFPSTVIADTSIKYDITTGRLVKPITNKIVMSL